MKANPLTCPHCGKPVKEPGACEACLPFNMYLSAWLQKYVGFDPLRQLMLLHVEELRQLPFEQAKMPLERVDPGAKVQTFVATLPSGQQVVMLPCVDVKGYKSILCGVEPSPLKDGHHRMTPFGLN
jgi:hypothetical protein